MKLSVNGSPRILADTRTLGELLDDLNHETARIAVAVNRRHIPRRQWDERELVEGDEVEILTPMAGG